MGLWVRWRRRIERKRYKSAEIVAKLRQVDGLVSQDQLAVDAVRSIGVMDVTYYRWRSEFGGLKTAPVKRMKDFELENQQLRKAISDLTLDKPMLSEASTGGNGTKLQPREARGLDRPVVGTADRREAPVCAKAPPKAGHSR